MFLKDLWTIWKFRHQLGYAKDVGKAVQDELARAATDARPIWQTYRFWSGVLMILGVIVSLIFGVLTIENAVTTELLVAIGTVVAGVIQIFAAKGQVKTERMIAAGAAQTNVLARAMAGKQP